jgi:hypothetical protein
VDTFHDTGYRSEEKPCSNFLYFRNLPLTSGANAVAALTAQLLFFRILIFMNKHTGKKLDINEITLMVDSSFSGVNGH